MGIGCALYQCVRVVPVPAWMLKLGKHLIFSVITELQIRLFFFFFKAYSMLITMQ